MVPYLDFSPGSHLVLGIVHQSCSINTTVRIFSSQTMASLLVVLLFLASISSSTTTASPFPPGSLPTNSGYLPIAPNSTAALFYAFYEAQHPTTPLSSTPLLVWLQGGPGCSSLLANFFELGPWFATAGPTLRPNPFSWNRLFGLLFIDNPLGSGFSISPSPDLIPRDQSTVARHLSAALESFLSSNPSFRTRPLFLTGESYAGKYVPATGYHILTHNPNINLAGVAIGDGLTHPVAQVATHADTAYYSGLINARQKTYLESLQTKAISLTLQANWSAAADARNTVLHWLQNVTGLATLYDLTKWRPYQAEVVGEFLNREEVRMALGIGKEVIWEECSDEVGAIMHEDVMKSVKYEVEELVRRSRVLLYQGIYDLRDGVASTEAWVKEMEWEGLERFLAAERKVWMVGGVRAGYVQRSGRLSQVVVAGAGHLVPADTGRSSQAMIEDWVLGKGVFGDRGSGEKELGFMKNRKVRADHKSF